MTEKDGETAIGGSLRAPRRAGVRLYLFVLFAVVASMPVVLLGIVQGKRLAASAVADTDRQTLATATAFSLQISLALTDYLRATESLAAQVRAHGGLTGNVSAALEAHTKPHPEFVGSYVARADGISFAHYSRATGPIASSQNYSNRDYYQELRRTGLPSISRVQVGRVTGSPDVQIVAPVRDAGGNMVGFVCTSVDLQRLSERAAVFARGLADGRLLVLDAERRVIADSTQNRATLSDVSPVALYGATAQPVTRVGMDEARVPTSATVVPVTVPSRGWSVIASVPLRTVQDSTARARTIVLLIALAALGLALTLAAFLSVRLAAPLRALAQSATQIAAGDAHQLPMAPRRAPRELAQVTEAVSHMVVALRSYAGGLQGLVEERTRELRAANDELAHTLGKLEREQAVLARDLAQARYFQERLLPSLDWPVAIDVATHFRPLEQVGGDIYDLVKLSPTRYRVLLADATGHGVQAAMRTIVIKFEYDRLKHDARGVDDLLGELNLRLIALFPEGELHCAAVCADLEVTPHGMTMEIGSAGGAQLFIGDGAALHELYVAGPLLGVASVRFEAPTRTDVPLGASVVFATDGLFEQMNGASKRFDSQLCEGDPVFQGTTNAEQRLRALVKRFDAFLDGQRPGDDVTVMLVQTRSA